MIRFHPCPSQLESFAEGSLSSSESLLVSAHCDMCSVCQKKVKLYSERLAQYALEPAGDMPAIQFNDMLARITQLPPAKQESTHESSFPMGTIELDGKTFSLPRSLHRLGTKTGNWSGLVGKLWQAPVELRNSGVANFIYMAKGGSVPEHTHRGTEFTLVLDGEFTDGHHHYRTGDFIAMDGEITHAPRSDFADGCLVFSIVDQPLHFTSGIARLLNPFSHLFFR